MTRKISDTDIVNAYEQNPSATMSEIAAMVGCTEATIAARVISLGLARGRGRGNHHAGQARMSMQRAFSPTPFAERVRQKRLSLGLSQQAFADSVRVNVGLVKNLEKTGAASAQLSAKISQAYPDLTRLATCPKCGKDLSGKFLFCPQCGREIE